MCTGGDVTDIALPEGWPQGSLQGHNWRRLDRRADRQSRNPLQLLLFSQKVEVSPGRVDFQTWLTRRISRRPSGDSAPVRGSAQRLCRAITEDRVRLNPRS